MVKVSYNRKKLLAWLILIITLSSCVSVPVRLARLKKKAPIDVAIIPGIPFFNDWSENEMKARVLWSYYLYSEGYVKNIIYSGSAVYSPYIEARIMAKYGEALGIPPEHIFCETKALHSTENLIYGYRLAKKLGFNSVALASDPFQASLLSTFAWDYHLKIDFIPFSDDILKNSNDRKITIDPSDAFVENFVPLPEKENLIKRIWGTMGLEVR